MAEKKNSKTNALLMVVIVLLVVVIIGGIAAYAKMGKKEPAPAPQTAAVQKIGMEAGVITNEEDAAGIEVGEPFTFTTLYERDIYITNGKEASCYIGNSDLNYYNDMYIQIYLNDENDEMAEEIYVSQIIPRGSHIESFTANRELEPGDYRGTLLHSCIDEEGKLAGDTPVIVEIHVAEE